MRSPAETKSYIDSFQLHRPLDGACVGQITESKSDQFEKESMSWELWMARVLDL